MTDYAELERLEREATPGPWETDATGYAPYRLWAGRRIICGRYDYDDGGLFDPHDAALIVALRNAAPALLAERREMLDVLRAVEWGQQIGLNACPMCDRRPSGGHIPDCRLAAMLRAQTVPLPPES